VGVVEGFHLVSGWAGDMVTPEVRFLGLRVNGPVVLSNVTIYPLGDWLRPTSPQPWTKSDHRSVREQSHPVLGPCPPKGILSALPPVLCGLLRVIGFDLCL
jgi:hypothetical protein